MKLVIALLAGSLVLATLAVAQPANIVDPNSNWQMVNEGFRAAANPTVDRDGNLYIPDASKILKRGPDGNLTAYREDAGGATALMFGGDFRMYASQPAKRRVITFANDGDTGEQSEQELIPGVDVNALAVTSRGTLYATDAPSQRIWFMDRQGQLRAVFDGRNQPGPRALTAVRLSQDERSLYVGDSATRSVWSFAVTPEGSLASGRSVCALSGAPLSMTLDTVGNVYVATGVNIEVCDRSGQVVATIAAPSSEPLTGITFGSAGLDYLYVTTATKLYRRHVGRVGVRTWEPVR